MKPKSVQWIDVTLTKVEKEALKKAYNDHENTPDILTEMLADGLSIKIAHDERNDCVSVFLLPVGDEHVNAGCIMTARSDEPWKAVFAAWFKHKRILKGDWRPRGGKKDDDFGDF